MQLSQKTQDAITKATGSKDIADQADATHGVAAKALADAVQHEAEATQLSLEAHKSALADAHDALADLAADLGAPLA